MPIYDVVDPSTGKKVQINASRPPTEVELRYVWSHPQHALPASLTAPVRINTDPAALEAAAQPLATGGLVTPQRAPQAPAPVGPMQLLNAPNAALWAGMGALADDPGEGLPALVMALKTGFRAPITPIEEQPSMGSELEKRGVPMAAPVRMAADMLGDPTNFIGGDPVGDVGKAAIVGGPAVAKGLGRLYSRLTEEVLPRFKAKAMHPNRILSDIKNFASPQEAEWTGLIDYLGGAGNRQIPKEEFEKYVKSNPLRLEEKRLAGQALLPLKVQRLKNETGYSVTHAGNFGVSIPDEMIRAEGMDVNEDSAREVAYRHFVPKSDGVARWGRSDLSLPGGSNYREIVITLPKADKPSYSASNMPPGWTVKDYGPDATLGKRYGILNEGGHQIGTAQTTQEEAFQSAYDMAYQPPAPADTFRHDSHWRGVDNPLTHLRLNDRVTADGKKALHIEELQSDWHQQGREHGYFTKGNQAKMHAADAADEAVRQAQNYLNDALVAHADVNSWDVKSSLNQGREYAHIPEVAAAVERLEKSYSVRDAATKAWNEVKKSSRIPDAPFKGTEWMNLGLKRALIEAVENGADELTWTTGRQQGKRYNTLLEGITGVHFDPSSGGQFEIITSGGVETVPAGDAQLDEIARLLPPEKKKQFDEWVTDRFNDDTGQAASNRPEDEAKWIGMLYESKDAAAQLRDLLITRAGVAADNPELFAVQNLMQLASPHAANDPLIAEALGRYELAEKEVSEFGNVMTSSRVGGRAAPKKISVFNFDAPLEIGSAGMDQQYDQAMVNIANKLGKPYDAQVRKAAVRTAKPSLDPDSIRIVPLESGQYGVLAEKFDSRAPYTIDIVRDKATAELRAATAKREELKALKHDEVHSLPITDKLRAQVLGRGLPMAGGVPAGALGAGAALQEDDKEASPFERAKKAMLVGAGTAALAWAARNPARLKRLLHNETGAIRAFHGSPHDFDKFDIGKVGTGEGNQAYGHGLYFAENPNVAEEYRRNLAGAETSQRTIIGGEPIVMTEQMPIADQTGWLEFNARQTYYNPAKVDVVKKVEADLRKTISNYDSGDLKMDKYHYADAQAALKFIEKYRGELSIQPKGRPGKTYEVNIKTDKDKLLDWDRPLRRQGPTVQKALTDLGVEVPSAAKVLDSWSDPTGELAYYQLADIVRGRKPSSRVVDVAPTGAARVGASELLKKAGVPGIAYLDQVSRSGGFGTHNLVISDDSLVDIVGKK